MSNQFSSMVLKELKISVRNKDGEVMFVKKFLDDTLNNFFKQKFRYIMNWYNLFYYTGETDLDIDFKMNNQIHFNLSTLTDVGSEFIDMQIPGVSKNNLNLTNESYDNGYIPLIQNIFKQFWANAIHGFNQYVSLKLFDILNMKETIIYNRTIELGRDIMKYPKLFDHSDKNKLYDEINRFDKDNFDKRPNYWSVDFEYPGAENFTFEGLTNIGEFRMSYAPEDITESTAIVVDDEFLTTVVIFSDKKIPINTKWIIVLETSERYYSDLKKKVDNVVVMSDAYNTKLETVFPIINNERNVKVKLELTYLGYKNIPQKLLDYLKLDEYYKDPNNAGFDDWVEGYEKRHHVSYKIRGVQEIYLNKDNFDPNKNI